MTVRFDAVCRAAAGWGQSRRLRGGGSAGGYVDCGPGEGDGEDEFGDYAGVGKGGWGLAIALVI